MIVVHNVHLVEVRRQLPKYNGDVHFLHMAFAWQIMLPGLGRRTCTVIIKFNVAESPKSGIVVSFSTGRTWDRHSF